MKDTKKCSYCGAEIDEGMNFCVYCMRSLDKKTAVVQKRKTFLPLIVAVTVVTVAALLAGAIILAVSKLSNSASHGSPEPDSALTDSQTEGVTALYTETGEITSAKAETRAETDAISSPDETEPTTDATAVTEAPNITEYVPQTTEEAATVKATDRVTEAKETEPETEPPQTEPATTHVHTDACLKWVVDVPYQAAVYKTEKIIDTPYSPAVYGDIPYEVNDCHYRVILYIKVSDLPSFSADHVILLDSTEEFLNWKEENGSADVPEDAFGTISDENFRYKFLTYDPYTTVKYEYGLISPEQPEVSHTEAVLVSPEREEQGHYEYICGYQP